MAWVTGVALILLTAGVVTQAVHYLFVGYWGFHGGSIDTVIRIVATVHGWAYLLYVICAFWVAMKLRWSLPRTVLLLLAGTIPFCSFIAERTVMRTVRADQVVAS